MFVCTVCSAAYTRNGGTGERTGTTPHRAPAAHTAVNDDGRRPSQPYPHATPARPLSIYTTSLIGTSHTQQQSQPAAVAGSEFGTLQRHGHGE